MNFEFYWDITVNATAGIDEQWRGITFKKGQSFRWAYSSDPNFSTSAEAIQWAKERFAEDFPDAKNATFTAKKVRL